MFRVRHAFLSVHCILVVTCLERAGLLALLYVMFSCVLVTFPCGVLCQVWYLIVLIPDLCLTYFRQSVLSEGSLNKFYVLHLLINQFIYSKTLSRFRDLKLPT